MNGFAAIRSRQAKRIAWLISACGFIGCFVATFFTKAHAFHAYWVAWVFWSGLGFGSLTIVMLHTLTGGAWGDAVRPIAEAGAMTIPALGLLFLPALLGLPDIFPWAQHGAFSGHDWPHKRAYLTIPWFVARAAGYFGVLAGWTWLLGLWDRLPKAPTTMTALSAGGLVTYAVIMLFASTDWVVSLEPAWYSTMFVVIIGIDHILCALAFAIVFLTQFDHAKLLDGKPMHDLGNLLLAFVIFWAYVTFSQFLIIWSGNLPREISWYLHRSTGGWPGVVIALAVFQFAVPFALLLLRITKRHGRTLGPVAALVLLAGALHVWWLIMPSLQTGGIRFSVLEPAAFAAIGGAWFAVFLGCHEQRLLVHPQANGEVFHA